MPVAQACECIRQAALALQHASAAGLVHRDIKPSNLMLTPDGCVKVLDLGLARLGPDLPREGYQDTREGPITSAGAVMGTMDYIAPEQLLDSRAVDSRTDLYSLGCTLYYLLTGGPPFGGSQEGSSGKRIAHLTKPFPDVRAARPDVPPDLSVIVDRLLAKNPDFRFSTPAELSAALVPFSFGGGLKGLTRTAAQIAETPPRKSIVAPSSTGAPTKPPHLVAWSVLAAVFLATIAVGIFILVVRNQRDNGGFGGPDQSRSNLIQALQVDHFRRVDAELHGLGLIGVKDAVRQGKDSFRVTGQLTQPAHLYLFAYFPDGKNFLCWPDEDAAPEATRTMVYPAHGVLPFNETGMHMFVLVAARKPLPAFDRWRPRPINWPKHEAQPVGAWKFTGRQFVGMQPEIGMPVPDACKEVCAALAARPDLDAVQAVAFSVLPDVPLK
jgi:hypothetical protein